MKRRNVSFRNHSKKFHRGAKRTRAINTPHMNLRGGTRF